MAAQWYIELKDSAFHLMSDWEVQVLENAVQQEHDSIEYNWTRTAPDGTITSWRYEIDLRAMTQTNTQFGTVRRLVRLASSTSHAVTSPFHR